MLKERRETVEDWMIKSVRVLPETVGQFTGLTDKNGVKIFEGDLVKTNGKGKNYMANKFYTVEFIDGAFCITAKVVKTGCDFSITIRDAMFKAKHYGETLEMEVIGNIHDNPELLHP